MNKIIDSVSEVVAKKVTEATKEILDGLSPVERLLFVGLTLIGLSAYFVHREGKNKNAQKGSGKSS